MDRTRRWGLLAAKVALAAAVVAYIASLIQRDAVRLGDLESVLGRGHWLVAAAGAFCVSYTVAVIRWWLLLRAMDLSPTGGEVVSLTLVGAFFNSFMPGAVGGDLVKAYYVARDRHGKRTAAVTTVLVDRFLGLFSLILVAMTAMLANAVEIAGNAALQPLAWAVVGVIAGVSFLGLVFFGMHRLPWLVRLAGRLPYRDRLHDLYTAL
ncbi:MAG: flippase-like domain-containing protein, partial [Planctomycetes bacterium]|nr:flippase-like domain-containing protein [Planctomycetota bacterium]